MSKFVFNNPKRIKPDAVEGEPLSLHVDFRNMGITPRFTLKDENGDKVENTRGFDIVLEDGQGNPVVPANLRGVYKRWKADTRKLMYWAAVNQGEFNDGSEV